MHPPEISRRAALRLLAAGSAVVGGAALAACSAGSTSPAPTTSGGGASGPLPTGIAPTAPLPSSGRYAKGVVGGINLFAARHVISVGQPIGALAGGAGTVLAPSPVAHAAGDAAGVGGLIDGATIPVSWADLQLQPTDTDSAISWSVIDEAIAHRRTVFGDGVKLRLRLYAGPNSPAWTSELAGTPDTRPGVPAGQRYSSLACVGRGLSHQGTRGDAPYQLPCWWDPAFIAAYQRMVEMIARRYDAPSPAAVTALVNSGQWAGDYSRNVVEVQIGGFDTQYVEYAIRGLEGSLGRINLPTLTAAGYREAYDRIAIQSNIAHAMRTFSATRLTLWHVQAKQSIADGSLTPTMLGTSAPYPVNPLANLTAYQDLGYVRYLTSLVAAAGSQVLQGSDNLGSAGQASLSGAVATGPGSLYAQILGPQGPTAWQLAAPGARGPGGLGGALTFLAGSARACSVEIPGPADIHRAPVSQWTAARSTMLANAARL